MIRSKDGGSIATSRTLSDAEASREYLLPVKRRVTQTIAEFHEYPNKITPQTIEDDVRLRVSHGTDVFAAMRQVLCGVVRWQKRDRDEG